MCYVLCYERCLFQKCEMESLVDELCVRLKEIQNDAADEGPVFLPPSDTPPYAEYVHFSFAFSMLFTCGTFVPCAEFSVSK